MSTSKQYQELLANDPGNPVFASCADELRKEKKHQEAMDVCLLGLSHNPECHRGRLVLARIYYERGHLPFAIREVEQLHRELPKSGAVRKLLEKLSPSSIAQATSEEAGLSGEADVTESSPAPKAAATKVDALDSTVPDNTVAEADFDFDELELISKK